MTDIRLPAINAKKKISILGDSISTLEGYSAPEDAVFYQGLRKLESDIFFPEDTWWGQVSEALGGEVLVNNSFSGSLVCKHPRFDYPSYGCSDERTSALGREGEAPDVILVFMGTNDWGAGMKTTPVIPAHRGDLAVFSVAYDAMLKKLRRNYPAAEIICFTPSVSRCSRMEDFSFPYRICGRHLEDYCAVIRDVAAENGCLLVDLYDPAEPYDTIDGFHPSAEGMKTLSTRAIRQLSAVEGGIFRDH